MTNIRDYACFVSGLSAGVALAFSFAPRSGAEFRNQIQAKVRRGADALREGKTAAGNALDRRMEGIGAALDAGKRAYQSTTGRVQRESTQQPAG